MVTISNLVHAYRIASIYVNNGLDVDVCLTVVANIANSHTGAVNMGEPFVVSAGSVDAKSLVPLSVGWLPWISVSTCPHSTPTSGTLTVKAVFDEKDIVTLMEEDIRDTSIHKGEWARW